MTVTVPRESPVRQLSVESIALDDSRPLIHYTSAHEPLVWSRNGDGMVGIGVAARLEFFGPNRVLDAARAWSDLVASATVDDAIGVPGSGLIAFGTFAFSDSSAISSVLIVPRLVVGRRDGQTWLTRITDPLAEPARPTTPEATPLGDEYRISLVPGSLTADGYTSIVADAIEHIRARDLRKVVLARDLVGHLPLESDARRAVASLALGYPDCWTYAVDGFVGSSPETLIRVNRGTVTARVLAGTISRGSDAADDREAAVGLAMSTKDQDEHRFAVQSVVAALSSHTESLSASEHPFTLKLPNLWHLATDVAGTLSDHSTALDLVEALHPTAAVAGTPTAGALSLIDELEPFDRGRYAGPVGWIGADGDGEWAIALRGAQISPSGDIVAYAGAGIVADSDPEHELAETSMKFRPIVEAFG